MQCQYGIIVPSIYFYFLQRPTHLISSVTPSDIPNKYYKFSVTTYFGLKTKKLNQIFLISMIGTLLKPHQLLKKIKEND